LNFTARLLDGTLKGAYTWTGAADHPEGQLTARLENAHWRAFPFSSDIYAVWGRDGLKPLSVKGRFKTGGQFEFNGLLSPDAQANGTLNSMLWRCDRSAKASISRGIWMAQRVRL